MNMFVGEPEARLRTVVGVFALFALVAVLRTSGKRTLSHLNAFDLVVTVALGSTLATILLSRDVSRAKGVLAPLVLVVMQYAVTLSSIRSLRVASIAKSEPAALVYRGRYLEDAMRRERVTQEEVREAPPKRGHPTPQDVDLIGPETDGSISVIKTLSEADHDQTSVAALVSGRRSTSA